MQRLTHARTLIGTATCLVFLGLSLATAAVRIEQMTGTIAAIDPDAKTVVVEVPFGKDKFTVGGPLSSTAIVTNGKRPSQLQALQVGAHATVSWRPTATGQEITRLDVRWRPTVTGQEITRLDVR
jgi:hypothetical protein